MAEVPKGKGTVGREAGAEVVAGAEVASEERAAKKKVHEDTEAGVAVEVRVLARAQQMLEKCLNVISCS